MGNETLNCPSCDALVESGDQFCSQCGEQISERCGTCGLVLKKNAVYCSGCGSKAGGKAAACLHCGRAIPDFYLWSYCPECGHIASSKCAKCGSNVAPQWKHCANCGRALESAKLDSSPIFGASSSSGSFNSIKEDELSSAEEYNLMGQNLYSQNRLEEAAEMFKRACQLDKTKALYHSNLATVYYDLNRDEDALDSYRTALELDPNDVVSMLGLGYIYAEREDKAGAERMWRRVIDAAPNSAEAEEARTNIKGLESL